MCMKKLVFFFFESYVAERFKDMKSIPFCYGHYRFGETGKLLTEWARRYRSLVIG